MTLSKNVKRTSYSHAPYELDDKPGAMVRRRATCTPDELLFRTLPVVLAADDTGPMAAWLEYFVRTEP